MRKMLFGFTCLLVVLFMNCSSLTVKTDYDPEYNFEEFKTYRWATVDELNPDDVLSDWPMVYKQVQTSVDKQLEKKGLTKMASGDADLVVAVHAGMQERMEVYQTSRVYYGGWYTPWWGAYGGSTSVSYYDEGTLVIDLVAWEPKELAWRGMGTGVVQEYIDPVERARDIDKVVAQILRSYPPK